MGFPAPTRIGELFLYPLGVSEHVAVHPRYANHPTAAGAEGDDSCQDKPLGDFAFKDKRSSAVSWNEKDESNSINFLIEGLYWRLYYNENEPIFEIP